MALTLTPDELWVRALYTALLGRPGSTAELDAWVAAVPSLGRPGVARLVYLSAEARARQVAGWYQTYLGRAPQNGEEQAWVAQLVAGQPETAVVSGILGSQEFYDDARS